MVNTDMLVELDNFYHEPTLLGEITDNSDPEAGQIFAFLLIYCFEYYNIDKGSSHTGLTPIVRTNNSNNTV